MAQQGPPPSRSGPDLPAPARRRDPRPPGRSSWDAVRELDDDEDYPPWAGMSVTPSWAGREERRRAAQQHSGAGEPGGGPGFRRRVGAARARRARLKSYIWGGAAVAVAAIVTLVLVGFGGSPRPKATIPGLVTTYQPGEMKTVPDACTSVTAATLSQVMQGKPTSLAPRSLDGKAQRECDWTVDAPPVYRHLEITLQAYAPSGLATGNGSATNAAADAYRQALQDKITPPRHSGMPKALVTRPGRLGSQAFAALQRVPGGGDVTDIETVVTRIHNVLVTVVLQGLARSHTGRYGKLQVPALAGGALALTRDVLSHLG